MAAADISLRTSPTSPTDIYFASTAAATVTTPQPHRPLRHRPSRITDRGIARFRLHGWVTDVTLTAAGRRTITAAGAPTALHGEGRRHLLVDVTVTGSPLRGGERVTVTASPRGTAGAISAAACTALDDHQATRLAQAAEDEELLLTLL